MHKVTEFTSKMPETRVPVDVAAYSDSDTLSVEDFNYKADDSSVRSSSPKSDSSVSEISETLSLEFSDVSDDATCSPDMLIEELERVEVTDTDAEEMMRKGADMRHVLCTSWKLQSKIPMDKKIHSKSSG